MPDKPIRSRVDEPMIRRNRDIDGEEAPEMHDGNTSGSPVPRRISAIPSKDNAAPPSMAAEGMRCARLNAKMTLETITIQSRAREPRSPSRVAPALARFLIRQTQLRHHVDQSEYRGHGMIHGRFPDHAGPNSLSSGPCSAEPDHSLELQADFLQHGDRAEVLGRRDGDDALQSQHPPAREPTPPPRIRRHIPCAQCRDRNANPTSTSARPSRFTRPHIPAGVPSSRQAAYKPKPFRS